VVAYKGLENIFAFLHTGKGSGREEIVRESSQRVLSGGTTGGELAVAPWRNSIARGTYNEGVVENRVGNANPFVRTLGDGGL